MIEIYCGGTVCRSQDDLLGRGHGAVAVGNCLKRAVAISRKNSQADAFADPVDVQVRLCSTREISERWAGGESETLKRQDRGRLESAIAIAERDRQLRRCAVGR